MELDEHLVKWFSIIGQNVIRLRGGTSQVNLAEKAKVARSSIRAIEEGRSINFQNLIKIANALGVSPADLFITDLERGEISYKTKLLMDLIDIKKK